MKSSTSLVSKYGNLKSFLVAFNPDRQYAITNDVDDCYFGEYPTLAKVNSEYCETAATQWLNIQLYNLSEYCGTKDKMTPQQTLECSKVIISMFYYLKVSEVMLFLFLFKSGKYGKFYGAIDPLTIISSLREFLKERTFEIIRHENESMAKAIEEYKKNAISYEEWKKTSNRKK